VSSVNLTSTIGVISNANIVQYFMVFGILPHIKTSLKGGTEAALQSRHDPGPASSSHNGS
jgi:hypothetical protein